MIMELTDEQKKKVAESVAAGTGLADIQRMILADFGISMTYMDVRFIVDDLGATLKDKDVPKRKVDPELADATVDDVEILDPEPVGPVDPMAGGANVSIEIDRITKPGAVASGTVVFSDGVKGSWMLDQAGRLALSFGQDDYKPSPSDVEAFQQLLTAELRKKGF
jgi:hypothetical protein